MISCDLFYLTPAALKPQRPPSFKNSYLFNYFLCAFAALRDTLFASHTLRSRRQVRQRNNGQVSIFDIKK
jgi:hypothetical protein